ncbi:MAG: HyaD/HybD family hydrogenase maturation endopeptidase [bacterium]
MEEQNIDFEYTQSIPSGPKPKIMIIGLGNILLQDEGIGVHIIKALQKMDIPDNIDLVDGGTAELDLMNYMNKGIDKVIIIDAVKGGSKAGTTFRLSVNEIMATTKHISSLHQKELIEAIKMLELFTRKPREIVILGIVPKETEWSLTLSPELQNKIPEITRIVFDEIEKK